MRLIINLTMFLMLVGVLVGVAMVYRTDVATEQALVQTREAVARFQVEIDKQSALAVVEGRRFPETVDPVWFETRSAPINRLLGAAHPWVEVASGRPFFRR